MIENTITTPSDGQKKERSSNFELLRIISIIFIVLMHVANMIVPETQSAANREVVVFINSITNTGVSLFILLSGYFGITFKKNRLLDIVFLVWFYSYLSLGVDYFFLHKSFAAKDIIPYIFPLLSRKWWFISCYVVLYCISKWINDACRNLSQQSLRTLLLVLGIFFYIAPTFLVFYELTDAFGKGIVNMALLYIIGRYIRLYGFPVFIAKHSKSILLTSILLIFALNSALTMVGHTLILRFASDNNLLILTESLSIFYLMSKMKFQNRFVNKSATFVFGIYLGQQMFIDVVKQHISLNVNALQVWSSLILVLFIVLFCCISTELLRMFISYPLRQKREQLYSHFPLCNLQL